MAIDWTKPLELMDGTPVRLVQNYWVGDGAKPASKTILKFDNPDRDRNSWLEEDDGAGLPLRMRPCDRKNCVSVTADGRHWSDPDGEPIIRNRTSGTELTEEVRAKARALCNPDVGDSELWPPKQFSWECDGPKANAEFVAAWIEEAQCWRVIVGDGYVLPASFPAIGYAANAAYDFLGLGESDFDVTEDTGTFYRYQLAEA